jgi:hypothetical protein
MWMWPLFFRIWRWSSVSFSIEWMIMRGTSGVLSILIFQTQSPISSSLNEFFVLRRLRCPRLLLWQPETSRHSVTTSLYELGTACGSVKKAQTTIGRMVEWSRTLQNVTCWVVLRSTPKLSLASKSEDLTNSGATEWKMYRNSNIGAGNTPANPSQPRSHRTFSHDWSVEEVQIWNKPQQNALWLRVILALAVRHYASKILQLARYGPEASATMQILWGVKSSIVGRWMLTWLRDQNMWFCTTTSIPRELDSSEILFLGRRATFSFFFHRPKNPPEEDLWWSFDYVKRPGFQLDKLSDSRHQWTMSSSITKSIFSLSANAWKRDGKHGIKPCL